MIEIGIYKIGYLNCNIEKLCNILNSEGEYYSFKYISQIQNIGNPDLWGYGYSDSIFTNVFKNQTNSNTTSVVLTSVPIEDNFFTRNIGFDLIISTTYQMGEIVKNSNLTFEECIAIGILEEIGSIEFQKQSGKHWSDLFHNDPRGCLFDFAGIKDQTLGKYDSLKLCSICEGKLSGNNINSKVISYLKNTLEKIKRPTLKKAFLKCINSPILSFFYGGIILGLFINIIADIIFSETIFNKKQIITTIILFVLIILFPILIYAKMWISIWQNKLRS